MAKIKLTGIVILLYIGIVAATIVIFTMLVNVLDNMDSSARSTWTIANFMLSSQELGLDDNHIKNEPVRNIVGRIQKLGSVLENATNKIESIEIGAKKDKKTTGVEKKHNEHIRRFCHIPKPTTQYPLCGEKIEYVQSNWVMPCYAMENNIRKDDLCSILIYLSEVEQWCARLPWRKISLTSKTTLDVADKKIQIRKSVDEVITKWFSDPNYLWMKNRITSMKKEWVTAIRSLSKKRPLAERTKKKILVYLGAFADQVHMLGQAFSGGPLGEMVQWSDIITSFYLLGHELVVITEKHKLKSCLPATNENGCITNRTVRHFEYDLLYTDIIGLAFIENNVGPYWSEIRCKTRIVDSFGTEAEFNYRKFSDTDIKYQSIWGNLELNLRQFMTMFPHSPDNSFIGFVGDAAQRTSKQGKKYKKKNIALAYAKQDTYWILANRRYLDKIYQHVEIHGTFNQTLGDVPHFIPRYVINHGVVNGTTIKKMLQQSKVFIGMGFPYEGPAPLEAVANGAAFLNPKFQVPHNRYNSKFFKSKPTRRLVTSQNPYAEEFIGEPYVYTIDITNVTEVTRAMKKIMNKTLKPYLPYEFTHEGMLERISVQVEHLNLCQDSQWPPLKNLKTVKGKSGQSCKHACWGKGMLCEPSYWDVLNQLISFRREKIFCDSVKYIDSPVAPSYEEKTKTCHLQQQPLLYSCVSSSSSHMRLCPCRDYIKGQVALCKDCW